MSMKQKEPGIDLVKVSVSLPKAVNDLVTKLAAVEGSTPSEWYWQAVQGYLEGLLGNAHDVFDVPRLVKFNGLQGLVGNP
jgi:hypothetical protein